jgi:hypothetical protein
LFPASADWTATSSNTSITGASGVISLAAETAPGDDDGVWWAGYRHWPGKRLIRKRNLKRLRQKAPGASLETTMAYLSHAKDTTSIACVANTFWRHAPEHRCRIHAWVKEHVPAIYPGPH